MRHTGLLLAGILATAISTPSARAEMRITADSGGRIIDYADRFLQARASGAQVVIDGTCLSACTLVIGMLPRDRICATPNAVLGFHAAWQPTGNGGKFTSSAATQAMMKAYPPNVRNWISRHGGLTTRMIFLHGRELAAIIPTCRIAASVGTRRIHNPHVLLADPSRATPGAKLGR
jgi:hypothetical protein